MTISWRTALPLVVGLGTIFGVALIDPIPQDPLYHAFVDRRVIVNIPNFMNVISNLPFLIVGSAGLLFVARNPDSVSLQMKLAWLVFFAGISLTAFGSAYYHLQPANDTLVWDRLPMTISFMSFVAIIAAEYYSASVGKTLLLPLLIVGFASVMYWSYTESLGRGDLRPYAIVQFVPMLLIPMVIALNRSRSDLGRYVWWMIGFYFVAKLAELFDAEIFSFGYMVSGHSLKHVIGALAPASLLVGLTRR